MNGKNAVFNDWDFAVHGLTINRMELYNYAPDLQLEDRAASDGSLLVSRRHTAKPVVLAGRMKAVSVDALDSLIDTAILKLSGLGGILDVDHAGGVRRFIASSSNVSITRARYGATIADFFVEFIVPSGYGMDTTASEFVAATVITASTASIAVTAGGSYKAQPLITISLTSVTGDIPPRSISISNPDNGSYITLFDDFETGDTIIIDSENKRALVNYGEVTFSGQFPTWEPGSGVIEYSDDLTTRSATLTANYTRRWL